MALLEEKITVYSCFVIIILTDLSKVLDAIFSNELFHQIGEGSFALAPSAGRLHLMQLAMVSARIRFAPSLQKKKEAAS